MRFDTHVCLVSGQATPNLTPVLAAEFRPKQVVLMVSEKMKAAADSLEAVFKKYQVKTSRLPVPDTNDMAAIETQLIAWLDQHETESVALNVTGGTKLMAIAAQEAFRMADKPVFYVDATTNEILFVSPKQQPSFVPAVKLKLEDYLNAHGYEVVSLDRQIQPIAPDLTNMLMTSVKTFALAIGELNRWAHEAEKKDERRGAEITRPCLQVTLENLPEGNFKTLLAWFSDAGLLVVEGKVLRFTSLEARFFANGGWLEHHTFGAAQKMKGVQDVAMNVEVTTPKGTKNELDLMILANNRLFLIECKTRNFKSGNANAPEALYKLDSLTALGGLNTQGMLLSYRPLKSVDKQRATDLGIKTIETDTFGTLTSQLQSWISSR